MYSPDEMAFFGLVDTARRMVESGYRMSYEDAARAKHEGFPQPIPAPGQIWWTLFEGVVCPVSVGQINSAPPRVYLRVGPNRFLFYDKRTGEEWFIYAPSPHEYDRWKNPVQSFDPVI